MFSKYFQKGINTNMVSVLIVEIEDTGFKVKLRNEITKSHMQRIQICRMCGVFPLWSLRIYDGLK